MKFNSVILRHKRVYVGGRIFFLLNIDCVGLLEYLDKGDRQS